MEPNITETVFNRKNLSDQQLIQLYKRLLYPRMIEEKMLKLLRQGQISKWFSGIGQEAISVGCASALQPDEKIFTMHRNLGVFTSREVPLNRLIAQWQGKMEGFTKGRDRSFHFGAPNYNIVGMISHLGPQLSLADGVALAHKIRKENKVSLAFTGEGGTSQGEFHEALNVAAVWNLPVIFVIENNGYGLSTPTSEQYRCEHLVDRAKGYGMKGIRIDGNNILEVYQTISAEAEEMRKSPRPVLIECNTFRMRGHEEASGTKYVPDELFEQWAKKDPLSTFENYLIQEKVITESQIESLRAENKKAIEEAVAFGFNATEPTPDTAQELEDVYHPHTFHSVSADAESEEIRFVDAISSGLNESMKRHDDLVLMGQDIADYGGVFKITDGFLEEFGSDRVRNTPLCESAIVGAALGLSIEGMKSMMEMQFADFVSCGFNQIVNNLAKVHYRWGQKADVVIRMPTGGTVGAGPFHSQSNEAWFTHTPGLKVVYPSHPFDAKGLLISAIEDPNPIIFFEHKGLYRSVKGDVPKGYYNVPIGQAELAAKGDEATIITYGMGVHWAKQWTTEAKASVDIVDLRTLIPLDWDTIASSIRKTHRVLILHEDTQIGGFGGEIAGRIAEELFDQLDAPVVRCSSLDSPVPFSKVLENNFMANRTLAQKMDYLLNY